MRNKRILNYLGITLITIIYTACSVPFLGRKTENKTVPISYNNSKDSMNTAKVKWNDFFTDANLKALIDTALKNNQELNIVLQEIYISKNEVRAQKGAYLPYIGAGAGAGVEKVGRYTSQGASDAVTNIAPGKATPEVLPNYVFGLNASWELDIWKKLRNSKKSAMYRYLSAQGQQRHAGQPG